MFTTKLLGQLIPLVAPIGRPVLLYIVGVYRSLLDEIVRRDYDVLSSRVSLSPWRKAVIGLQAVGGQFVARGRRVPDSAEISGRVTTMTRKPKPPPPHVVIVGGGLAGLACASALVGRGLRLTLLESRPRLGGRASSFTDPATGELVDNCQHVSMACCTNLADFWRRVGIDSMIRRETELLFLSPERSGFEVPGGNSPCSFSPGRELLAVNDSHAFGEKIQVAYGLALLTLRGTNAPANRSANGWCATARACAPSICSGPRS